MPLARLQAKFTQSAIDSENGIISGVKVMELGKLARFSGEDGKQKQVTITEAHISALLAHAGNRSIPSHWSHDYFEGIADPIHARVGALKSFRKDESGNLIADLHLAPGGHRDTALWNAVNAPEHMMLSAVFDYAKDDALCTPLNFQAADLVSEGAATTALLNKQNDTAKMAITLDDFKEVLSTAEGEAYMNGILKAHGKLKAKTEEDAADEMEKSAGVTDADKAGEPAEVAAAPAALRSMARMSKAIARQLTSLNTEKAALMAEVETKASAAATALLGKGGFIQAGTGDESKGDVEAKLSAYVTAGAKNRGVAIMRFAHDKPDEYNAAVKAGKL